ncbi:MAG: DUF2225 domain-containing protein [Lachnospiraceae bacterium]|nr:DUF2225 domain-containing protein [Lachnospiraceae bacterium]
MGLFDGLESMGLGGLGSVDIYAEEPQQKEKKVEETVQVREVREADFLLTKEFECHICARKFKQRTMRPGKAKLLSQDSILRPVFDGIDSTKYDVILCPYCGYAVLTRYYAALAKPHKQLIKDNISANFKQMPATVKDEITYEEAFQRYKLALLNAVVRQGKNSEKGFICLKTAWLLRAWMEKTDTESLEGKKLLQQLKPQEKEYMVNALEGFIKARGQEPPPYAGMNEVTLDYLIGALSAETGERLQDGGRMLASVLGSNSAGEKLKERAREVLEVLKNKMKEEQA